ncbi:hypothetical protein PMAYCL1PPCAC_19485, partial [Pristionchus mayeri]
STLVSDQVKGYDINSFSKLLDKLELEDNKALTWPLFRINVYCKNNQCARWNNLKSQRTVSLPEKTDEYYKKISDGSKFVGFTNIGSELLRGQVLVYSRRERLIFIADRSFCRQPFAFMISKKRKDLVEKFNRAVAMTASVYPRIMTRYLSPYGVYSNQIQHMEVSQLKLSNFESVWQFFAVCTAIIICVFITEVVV